MTRMTIDGNGVNNFVVFRIAGACNDQLSV